MKTALGKDVNALFTLLKQEALIQQGQERVQRDSKPRSPPPTAASPHSLPAPLTACTLNLACRRCTSVAAAGRHTAP